MQNRKYFDDALCGLQDVLDLDKPLLIVSEGKETLAYETVVMMAERAGMKVELAMLRCEDGELHEHAFVHNPNHPEVGPFADLNIRALRWIDECQRGLISRPRLQWNLGTLLGYTLDERLEFIASATARECPCDCCGGPFVPEEYFDTCPPPAGYARETRHGMTVVDLLD